MKLLTEIKTFKIFFMLLENVCTRAFQESDLRYSANGKQRPPAGTKCISGCIFEAGRWGASWCNTKDDNWGTGCVPCEPGKTFNTNEIACVLKIK